MKCLSAGEITQSLIILRPKNPYLSWIKKVEPELELTLEQVYNLQAPMLIKTAKIETLSGARNWAYSHWGVLWDKMLFDWCTNEHQWPQERNLSAFKDWFEIQWFSDVWEFSHASSPTS